MERWCMWISWANDLFMQYMRWRWRPEVWWQSAQDKVSIEMCFTGWLTESSAKNEWKRHHLSSTQSCEAYSSASIQSQRSKIKQVSNIDKHSLYIQWTRPQTSHATVHQVLFLNFWSRYWFVDHSCLFNLYSFIKFSGTSLISYATTKVIS